MPGYAKVFYEPVVGQEEEEWFKSSVDISTNRKRIIAVAWRDLANAKVFDDYETPAWI